jgi:hypothetical protein
VDVVPEENLDRVQYRVEGPAHLDVEEVPGDRRQPFAMVAALTILNESLRRETTDDPALER